jgi:hypothetical protein
MIAGHHAWSISSPRYNLEAEDPYPGLRAQLDKGVFNSLDALSAPISSRVSRSWEQNNESAAIKSPDAAESPSVVSLSSVSTHSSEADGLEQTEYQTDASRSLLVLKEYEQVSRLYLDDIL